MTRDSLARIAKPDRIALAARHIQRISEQSALRTALVIGRFLLDTFYEGDFEQVHDRSGGPAIRALAAHPDLQLSAAYLYSSLAILEQVQRWPDPLVDGLSLSHHRQLLAVRSPEARLRLATRCWERGWSGAELAERIREQLPPRSDRRGRPAKPQVVRCGELVKDQLEQLDGLDPDRLFGRLGPEEAFEAVERALRDATELGNRLRRLRVLARSRR